MEALFVVAVLIGLFSPVSFVAPATLADFDRLHRKVGVEVYVIDVQGLERVGRLLGADASTLRLDVPAGEIVLQRPEVVEVDRRRDSVIDGTVKGVLFGGLMGAAAFGGRSGWWLRSAAIYGAIGFALDSAHGAREPLYRAPRTPSSP